MSEFKSYEVKVGLNEVIARDLEGFLDLISMLATGTELLCDLSWEVAGIDPDGLLILLVTGDPSMIEEDEVDA